MPNIREEHRGKIKTLLTGLTITGQAQPMPVFDYYTRTSDTYPYIFIGSQDAVLNYIDTGTYDTRRRYTINIVHQINDDSEDIQTLEKQVDEAESLVLAKLRDDSTRNYNWQDLIITSVSAPFNGVEADLTENCVVQTILVEVWQTESYFN